MTRITETGTSSRTKKEQQLVDRIDVLRVQRIGWRLWISAIILLLLGIMAWPWLGRLYADANQEPPVPVMQISEMAQPSPLVKEANARFTLLVFSKTAAYRHPSIDAGKTLLQNLAETNDFTVQFSEDAAVFTDTLLADFDGVLFLNTTGDILNDVQQAAFERFIQAGHGFIGVHSASDTEYEWPWYGGLIGAYFKDHPAVQDATLSVRDSHHPSTMGLPDPWPRRDEWYNFRSQPDGVDVLLTVDEESYSGGTMGATHPIAWYHAYDGGRAWYTAMGHTPESFDEPFFQQHLLGGIRWAVADLPTVEPERVTGFVLINAESDEDLIPLTDGATVDLATMPTTALNLRAQTVPIRVGSVRFMLNDNPYFAIENLFPYTLAGDTRGDAMAWTLPTGTYTLTAIPYSAAMVTGTAGISHTIAFTLVNSALRNNDLTAHPIEQASQTSQTSKAVLGHEQTVDENFSALTTTATINGVLYLDENLNQQADPLEVALVDLPLRVDRVDQSPAVTQTVVTDSAGGFLLANLPAGQYQIAPLLPESLQALNPTAGILPLIAGSRTELPDFLIRNRSDSRFVFLPTIHKVTQN